MFFYYGSKRRGAKTYPPPSFDTIIEPFAGAAAYSMYHVGSAKRVILIEKDPRVVATWHRVLAMTPQELLDYPIPAVGEPSRDFLVMTAATSSASAGVTTLKVTDRVVDVMPGMLRKMAALLPLAKERVEVVLGDYRDAPNLEATWFIEPPYRVTEQRAGSPLQQGMGYAKGCNAASLDYDELGAWCRERRGQRIVCEQEGADWLPFRPTGRARTANSLNKATGEVVWLDPEYQLELALGGAVRRFV